MSIPGRGSSEDKSQVTFTQFRQTFKQVNYPPFACKTNWNRDIWWSNNWGILMPVFSMQWINDLIRVWFHKRHYCIVASVMAWFKTRSACLISSAFNLLSLAHKIIPRSTTRSVSLRSLSSHTVCELQLDDRHVNTNYESWAATSYAPSIVDAADRLPWSITSSLFPLVLLLE